MKARKHHLDGRADRLIAEGAEGHPDDLLPTSQTAIWLGTSTQWLEIGRSRGYGPKFVRVSPRKVRYRRRDVLDWLRERTYASTSEYDHDPGSDGRVRSRKPERRKLLATKGG